MSLIAPGNTDPGRLDQRVRLLYPRETRDATGGISKTWHSPGKVWAGRQFIRGGRMYAAEQKHGEDIVVFRIRSRTDVSRFWQLVHGDDVYEIVALDPVGRDHFIDLTCRAIDQSPGNNFVQSIVVALRAAAALVASAIKDALGWGAMAASAALSAQVVKDAATVPGALAATATIGAIAPLKDAAAAAALAATAASLISERAASNQRATSAADRRVTSSGDVRIVYQYN